MRKHIAIISSILLLTSCEMSTIYHKYKETPLQGWGKNDTLTFDIPPITRQQPRHHSRCVSVGNSNHPTVYATTLGIRINGSYPFTSLSLIMETTIHSPLNNSQGEASSHFRESRGKTTITDTIRCRFVDSKGKSLRQGTSHFQYTFPSGYLYLKEKDSLHITVRHCMKRDILPGISDIGIKISESRGQTP